MGEVYVEVLFKFGIGFFIERKDGFIWGCLEWLVFFCIENDFFSIGLCFLFM